MLRASSAEAGTEVVAHESELRAFAEALARGLESLPQARTELRRALGEDVFVEAAAVAAAFHGYVRVADGTGIPVDELVVATSAELRDELGINAFPGIENSDLAIEARPASEFDPKLPA